jgi:DNA polymerase-1
VDAWAAAQADRIAMLMQVHDELVFEVDADFVDEAKAVVLARMEAAATLHVPLRVEAGVGASWDEAH